jgi:ADP-ribose pyrophosphatase
MSESSAWRLLRTVPLLDTGWFTVSRKTYERHDRVQEDYYIVQRADFVSVVALAGHDVVVVRQYRHATDSWYWTLPAGFIEVGEMPVEAAGREMVEETGFRLSKGIEIGVTDPLPGYVRSRAFVVVGEVGPLVAERDNEVDVVQFLAWDQALLMIASGEINEMQTVTALLLAKLLGSVPAES